MTQATHNNSLKVWALSSGLLICFVLYSFIMWPIVYVVMKGTVPPGTVGAVFLFGSLYVYFIINILFTRIRVDSEGVMIRTLSLMGNIHFGWDELDKVKWSSNMVVSFKPGFDGRRFMSFSGGAFDYYIVPFRYRELAEAIQRKTPLEAPVGAMKRPHYPILTIVLLPTIAWALLFTALRHFGFILNPLVDASTGGVIWFCSMSYFVYKSWNRYRIGNLGRLGSALASGLMAGGLPFLLDISLDLVRG